MNPIKVKPRPLSLGEILENERRARLNRPADTETRSIKLADGWYKFYQAKKRK